VYEGDAFTCPATAIARVFVLDTAQFGVSCLHLPCVQPPLPERFFLAHARIFVYVDHIWSTTVSVLLAAFCNQGADRGESEAQCMANTKSLAEN
jgi:hypothetical protein